MKKLSSPFARLLAVAGCALALGSCNRADYAMLPKASPYYGEASHRRAVAAPAATQRAAEAAAPAPEVAAAPVVAAAPAVVAAPTAPQAAKPATVAAQDQAATTIAAAPAPKPTLVQRMLAKKLMKNLNRTAARMQHKDATAATARLDGNLRTAILFGLVGVILEILGGVAGIFYVIGTILVVIGLIFLVLWLLDQV